MKYNLFSGNIQAWFVFLYFKDSFLIFFPLFFLPNHSFPISLDLPSCNHLTECRGASPEPGRSLREALPLGDCVKQAGNLHWPYLLGPPPRSPPVSWSPWTPGPSCGCWTAWITTTPWPTFCPDPIWLLQDLLLPCSRSAWCLVLSPSYDLSRSSSPCSG